MRIPFPVHIRLWHAVCFAGVLGTAQLLEGTSLYFSICCILFIVVATLTFNLAGGLSRPSGAYVFFYAVLVVIVGLCWKAVVGEPADSNLSAPSTTIRVYLAGICSMFVAVWISRKLTPKRSLLDNLVTDANMQSATVGCMVVGIALTVIFSLVPSESGSVLSALAQLNRFLPLAIILGTIHEIRKSGGTRGVSIPVFLSGAIIFFGGVLGFSKEGMITPFLCWLLAAASRLYKVSLMQIMGGILVTFFIFQYLVPYSQYGRNYRTESFSENLAISINFFSNLGYVRSQYIQSEMDANEDLARGYFTNRVGFFERLQMIGPDDSLISFTEQHSPIGLYPIPILFANLVPHFIWPNKPVWRGGNMYAREMGNLAEDDITTGISFSPTGEAFRLAGWTGVFIVAPLFWFVTFTLFDSLCGDVRKSPWGLIIIIVFSHLAPEGGIGGMVYAMGYITAALFFSAYMAAYLMPIVGDLVIGPNRRPIQFIDSVRRSSTPFVPLPPRKHSSLDLPVSDP